MTPKLADQAERLRNDFSAKETKIICISGGKGGVGKSLISVNVAVEIATPINIDIECLNFS